MELNGAHQPLVYADGNILGGSESNIDKNPEVLVVAINEIGLEINADNTKYMGMYRDKNVGRIHHIKIDNRLL